MDINIQSIESVKFTTYLGLAIDDNLKFDYINPVEKYPVQFTFWENYFYTFNLELQNLL